MEQKLENLLGRLKACGSLVIALSGGVDSSTLAKAASVALGDKAVAVTARSELLSADELADAKAMARASGIRHIIVDARDLDDSQIVKNDKERCYYCKRGRFQKLVAWARENGFAFVADGGNLDDKNDYRPGMKAIEELAPTVISPQAQCRLPRLPRRIRPAADARKARASRKSGAYSPRGFERAASRSSSRKPRACRGRAGRL